jgi:hypothetical protein
MKARILLKADVGECGEGWNDNKIIEALGTSVSTPNSWWKRATPAVSEDF